MEETSLTVRVNKRRGWCAWELTHDSTVAGSLASANYKLRGIAGNVPIVQPIYNLWHFFDQEPTVNVHGVPCENSSPLPRNPLFDVV